MIPMKETILLDERWMHEVIGENILGDETYNSLRCNWEEDSDDPPETEYLLRLTVERVRIKDGD